MLYFFIRTNVRIKPIQIFKNYVIFLRDIRPYIRIEITPYYGVGKLISVKFFTMNPGGDFCAK